jgi:hypothetical protein
MIQQGVSYELSPLAKSPVPGPQPIEDHLHMGGPCTQRGAPSPPLFCNIEWKLRPREQ